MTATRLLLLLGDVDSRFIDDTPIENAAPPKSTTPPYVWGMIAACTVILVVCTVLLFGKHDENTLPLASDTVTTSAQASDESTATTAAQSTEKNYILVSSLACYSEEPDAGEYYLDWFALDYLRQTDPNGKVWVSISMFSGGPVNSGPTKVQEINRLLSAGYELYRQPTQRTDYFTGETGTFDRIFAHMTLEELENFDAGDTVGYMISQAFESDMGDGLEKIETYG